MGDGARRLLLPYNQRPCRSRKLWRVGSRSEGRCSSTPRRRRRRWWRGLLLCGSRSTPRHLLCDGADLLSELRREKHARCRIPSTKLKQQKNAAHIRSVEDVCRRVQLFWRSLHGCTPKTDAGCLGGDRTPLLPADGGTFPACKTQAARSQTVIVTGGIQADYTEEEEPLSAFESRRIIAATRRLETGTRAAAAVR